MRSCVTYSRCLLHLLLPILIVFSLRFFPCLSSSSIEVSSKNSLSQPSVSSIKSTVVRTKSSKCRPFNVSDTRPFFEREPPQLDLPRHISNSTRNNLYHRSYSCMCT
ncbi:unnamed protein product [Rotaria sp. Silwood2]|nr:unnamed protein product [Rotaria sp. Silwood2]